MRIITTVKVTLEKAERRDLEEFFSKWMDADNSKEPNVVEDLITYVEDLIDEALDLCIDTDVEED